MNIKEEVEKEVGDKYIVFLEVMREEKKIEGKNLIVIILNLDKF